MFFYDTEKERLGPVQSELEDIKVKSLSGLQMPSILAMVIKCKHYFWLRSQISQPQISLESRAGKNALWCLSCPKAFIEGQFWGHTVEPNETLDWSGITILAIFDRENLAKFKHA